MSPQTIGTLLQTVSTLSIPFTHCEFGLLQLNDSYNEKIVRVVNRSLCRDWKLYWSVLLY